MCDSLRLAQSVRITLNTMNKSSKIGSLNVLFFHYLKLDADDSSSLVRAWNVAIFISQDVPRRVFSINVRIQRVWRKRK